MATVQGQPSVPTDTAELVFFSRVDAWLVLCVGLSIGLCFFLAWAHQSLFALAVGGFTGIRVEVTGPWAPYSFAMPPAERRQNSATGEVRG